MNRTKTAFAFALLAVPLATGVAGCTKSDTGAALGAVAGGILGNQIGKGSGQVVATAIGAFVGGVVGSEIGRHMDEADRKAASSAEYSALEYGRSGSSTTWRNPDSGYHGSVVADTPYKRDGRHCRKYTHTIYIDGEPETLRGKACRNTDGTWSKV
jgi:surface antigen